MITEEDFVLYVQSAVCSVGNKIEGHLKESLVTPAQWVPAKHRDCGCAVVTNTTPQHREVSFVIERK